MSSHHRLRRSLFKDYVFPFFLISAPSVVRLSPHSVPGLNQSHLWLNGKEKKNDTEGNDASAQMISLFFFFLLLFCPCVYVFIFSHANGMTPGDASVGSLLQHRLKYHPCPINDRGVLHRNLAKWLRIFSIWFRCLAQFDDGMFFFSWLQEEVKVEEPGSCCPVCRKQFPGL